MASLEFELSRSTLEATQEAQYLWNKGDYQGAFERRQEAINLYSDAYKAVEQGIERLLLDIHRERVIRTANEQAREALLIIPALLADGLYSAAETMVSLAESLGCQKARDYYATLMEPGTHEQSVFASSVYSIAA